MSSVCAAVRKGKVCVPHWSDVTEFKLGVSWDRKAKMV